MPIMLSGFIKIIYFLNNIRQSFLKKFNADNRGIVQ